MDKQESEKQSPIFSKSYDFLVWLSGHTEKYPKSERFRLAKRLEDTAYTFYELLLFAARLKKPMKTLLEADYELEKLRLYVRLSHSRKLMKSEQYQFASGKLIEMGRLLGGWIKAQPE